MLLKSLFTSLFLISYLLSFTTAFSNLPMGTNSSTLQLQKRQLPTVHCGDKVSLRDARRPAGKTRTCTLGFAVRRKEAGGGQGKFDHGYLTLGDCVPTRLVGGGGHIHNVMLSPQNTVIGKTYNNQWNAKYDPLEGLDYAIIRITEPKVWDNGLSVGIASNDLNQPPVIRTLAPIIPAKGKTVCYSSAYSGLICGKLIFTDNEFTRYNPWMNGQADYFFRVGVVGLKFPPLPLNFNSERREDYGAPVFVPVYDQCEEPRQMIAAHPVGLFLDYSLMPFVIPEFQGLGLRLNLIPFSFYYQPLGNIFPKEPNLRLLVSRQNLANSLAECD